MATKGKTRVNAELDAALAALLKTATAKPKPDADGKVVEMSLTDKMKIIDRVLKWEQVKAQINEDGYGSGFAED